LETCGIGVRIGRGAGLRDRRWREVSDRQCPFDIVAEPAHGHTQRVREPALAMARRRGLATIEGLAFGARTRS
jgi:hypothetical protein